MSSLYVRTQVKQFLTDNAPAEYVVDLTSLFGELREYLSEVEIQPDAPWLGIQFVGGEEVPVSLPATNSQGLYRETGSIQIHIVEPAALAVGSKIVARGETLINLFRGQRIGDIFVDSITRVNTETGSTLEFEAGMMSGTFTIAYRRDLSLGVG